MRDGDGEGVAVRELVMVTVNELVVVVVVKEEFVMVAM